LFSTEGETDTKKHGHKNCLPKNPHPLFYEPELAAAARAYSHYFRMTS
jgi:hypothetical protein